MNLIAKITSALLLACVAGCATSKPVVAPYGTDEVQACRNAESDAKWVYQQTARTSDYTKWQEQKSACETMSIRYAELNKPEPEETSSRSAGEIVAAAFSGLAAGAHNVSEAARANASDDDETPSLGRIGARDCYGTKPYCGYGASALCLCDRNGNACQWACAK